jgi:hypothetical protein
MANETLRHRGLLSADSPDANAQPSPNSALSKPHIGVVSSREEGGLFEYWSLIRDWWKLVTLCTLVVVVFTGVVTKFVLDETYRARAIIRPASDTKGPLGEAKGLVSQLTGGAGDEQEMDAEKYIAIMNSFKFTSNLIRTHGLLARLSKEYNEDTPWKLYEAMKDHFDSDYNLKNGTLSIGFIDRSPAQAKVMLGYYVDALRDQLRAQTAQTSTSAINSMTEEVSRTTDPMLQTELYEFIAFQIQKRTTAQAEVEFAFDVIEPPVVPDRKYSPRPMVDCALAAILVPLLMFSAIQVWRRAIGLRQEFEQIEASRSRIEPDPPRDYLDEGRSESPALRMNGRDDHL